LNFSLSLTAEQLNALEHVLGCVYDNERDKGTDGIGNDMLESIEHYHDKLYPLTAATDGTYHWNIPFHIAGLIEFFIDCYGDLVYYADEAETQERNAETVLAPVRAQLNRPTWAIGWTVREWNVVKEAITLLHDYTGEPDSIIELPTDALRVLDKLEKAINQEESR